MLSFDTNFVSFDLMYALRSSERPAAETAPGRSLTTCSGLIPRFRSRTLVGFPFGVFRHSTKPLPISSENRKCWNFVIPERQSQINFLHNILSPRENCCNLQNMITKLNQSSSAIFNTYRAKYQSK